MTNCELIEKLLELPLDDEVLIDTGPYDEPVADVRWEQPRCSDPATPCVVIIEAAFTQKFIDYGP